MNKTSNYIRTICEIGIFAAIGYVLDELQGILSKGLFINGGSIGFAMIAVLIIGYRRGWLAGLLTGLIMGLLDIATSAYILHPAQLFLDYILPYAFVSFGCLFRILFLKEDSKKGRVLWLLIGTLVGGLMKLLSHYLAGVLFWADPDNFAWGLNNVNAYLYCFIYNIAFIGPSIILTGGLLSAIYIKAPRILLANDIIVEDVSDKKSIYPLISTSIMTAGGLFCFIWYLIDYIKSFEDYHDEGAYGYDFNPDSMLIFVLALFIVILGILSFIRIKMEKHSPLLASSVLLTILNSSLIYGIARLIRAYVKEKDPTVYWIWFIVGLITALIAGGIVTYFAIKKKKAKE